MTEEQLPHLGLDMARVIDRRVYTDPLIYKTEMSQVFARTWQFVAHESELQGPGDYISATIGEQPVILCKNRDGALNAFYNVCTHRGAVLTTRRKGNCGAAFRCMYHGWTFDQEGRCIGVPYPDAYGQTFSRDVYDIPSIRVETFAGLVFVSLNNEAEPLEEYLGEVGPYVREVVEGSESLGRVRWAYDGNWKSWHENFADNYHPEFTHPVVGTGYRGIEVAGNNYWLDEGHGMLRFPPQRDPQRIVAAMRETSGLENNISENPLWQRPPFDVDFKQDHRIITVFPNMDLQFMAGGMMNIIQVLRPQAVNRTVVELLALGTKGESGPAREWRLQRTLDSQASSGKVSGDDNEAVVRCQMGFAASAVPWSNMSRGQGPGKIGEKRDEYSMRSFYHAWRRYMGEHAL